LDEWAIFEGMGEDKTVRNTLKITKVALDRMKRWKGLPNRVLKNLVLD